MRWGMEILSPSSYHSGPNWLLEESRSTKWTPAENKMFENALAIYDKDTPDRWQRVAAMIPGKTVRDVMRQYKELEDDVSSIEAGLIPIPWYNSASSPFTLEWGNGHGFDGFKQGYGPGGKRPSSGRGSDQERKKGVPWTEEEHKSVLLNFEIFGLFIFLFIWNAVSYGFSELGLVLRALFVLWVSHNYVHVLGNYGQLTCGYNLA